MRSQNENLMVESDPAEARPIELVTENEFSILRVWEIDRGSPPPAGAFRFLVRNPQSMEREITVEIAGELVTNIELKTMRRIQSESTYWICCAERHLATYVWENDDYPPGDRICVDGLNPEDLMSAIRWGTG